MGGISMETIKIHCQNCKAVHTIKRTLETPHNTDRMECNWCAACEDDAKDYYHEWYVRKYTSKPVDNLQLNLQI